MVVASDLRVARLRMGMTLDEISLLTNGELNPARVSRIERGFAKPTEREVNLLIFVLGVTPEVAGSVERRVPITSVPSEPVGAQA